MFSLLAVNVTLAICCGRSAANPSAAVAAVDRRERQTLDRFVASARHTMRVASILNNAVCLELKRGLSTMHVTVQQQQLVESKQCMASTVQPDKINSDVRRSDYYY